MNLTVTPNSNCFLLTEVDSAKYHGLNYDHSPEYSVHIYFFNKNLENYFIF